VNKWRLNARGEENKVHRTLKGVQERKKQRWSTERGVLSFDHREKLCKETRSNDHFKAS
jgi:hypothetical protein